MFHISQQLSMVPNSDTFLNHNNRGITDNLNDPLEIRPQEILGQENKVKVLFNKVYLIISRAESGTEEA